MNSLKKIYDWEVTPPAGAWKAIARELDNLDFENKLSQKLEALEVTPPPAVWSHIAAQLDEVNQENKLSKKLYNTEVTPPPAMWDKISRELDDQEALKVIEKKLAHLEVQPPAGTWASIRSALDAPQQKPAATVASMGYGWLKYIAAACFITIISITAYFIFKDESASDNAYTADNIRKELPASSTASIKKAAPVPQDAGKAALAGIRTKLGNAYVASQERNTELQNRYIILMTPEGNIVRMSKKVSNLADCIAGEDSSCDEQISQWQKEMANNAAVATPDNFLDMLDIAAGSQN